MKTINLAVLAASLIFATLSCQAQNFDIFNTSRAPDAHTRNEGLQQGAAEECVVSSVRNTTIEASTGGQVFGSAVGAAVGTAAANTAHNANYALSAVGALLGGSIGAKVSGALGTSPAQAIYLKCAGAKSLKTVVQEATEPVAKGDAVLLEQIGGRYRVTRQ